MQSLYDANSSSKDKKCALVYSEADFDNIISAYDDAMTRNFGIIPKRPSGYESKNRISNENETDEVRQNNVLGYTNNYMRIRNMSQEGRLKNDGAPRDISPRQLNNNSTNAFVHQIESTSVPQSLDKPNIKVRRAKYRDFTGQSSNRLSQSKSFSSSSFKDISGLAENGWKSQTLMSGVKLNEMHMDQDGVAVGVPNTRKLPIVPTSPRVDRMCTFFTRLKNGLCEWIDLETNLLQQAELDQNSEDEKELADSLARFKHRLRTITQLEQDYLRYYKRYRELHSLNEDRQSFGGSVLFGLKRNGLSKSALVLTTNPHSGSSEHLTRPVKSMWGSVLSNNALSKEKPNAISEVPSDSGIHLKQDSSAGSCEQSPASSETRYKSRRSRGAMRRLTKGDSLQESNAKQLAYLKQQLCQIEAQTEYLSGTMKFEIIGVSGSQRYFNKNEFKISIKHGPPTLPTLYELHQTHAKLIPINKSNIQINEKFTVEDKWHSHGRVHTSHSIGKRVNSADQLDHCASAPKLSFPKQIWDNPAYVFSPAIDSVVTVKACEMRRFGRDELLQHQAFDVMGLLTPRGYHLSTPLKYGNRVQFHLMIHWSPIADTDDLNLVYYTPSPYRPAQKISGVRLASYDDDDSHQLPHRCAPPQINSNQTSLESVSVDSCFNDGVRTNSCNIYCTETTHSNTRVVSNGSIPSQGVKILTAHPNRAVHLARGITGARLQCISMPDLDKTVGHGNSPTGKSIKPNNPTIGGVLKPRVSSDLDMETTPARSISIETNLNRTDSERLTHGLGAHLEWILYKLGLMEKCSCRMFGQLFNTLQHKVNRLKHSLEERDVKTPLGKSCTSNASKQTDAKESKISESSPTVIVRKQDTLTNLWETFNFLEDSQITEEQPPSSKQSPGSSESVADSDCSDLLVLPPNRLSSGSNQLDLVIQWHLDYVGRLLNKMTPVTPSATMKACAENNRCAENVAQMDLVHDSVEIYMAAVALLGQLSVLDDLLNLTEKVDRHMHEPLADYVLEYMLGQSTRFENARDLFELFDLGSVPRGQASKRREPKLLVEVRPLQQFILHFYADKLSTKWPEIEAKSVIDTLFEDLLDIAVNGENLTTIPVTHLKQRLRLSPRSASCDLPKLDDHSLLEKCLYQVLFYLSGQQYVQHQLNGPSAYHMLCSMPNCSRTHQALFGVWRFNGADGSSPVVTRVQSLESHRLPMSACYSSKTWLVVSALCNSKARDVATKAASILCDLDREVKEVLSHLRFKQAPRPRLNSCELPILFTAGPPLHLSMVILNLIGETHYSPIYLPPIWISLCLGLGRHMEQANRVSALNGLGVLLQHLQGLLNDRMRLEFTPRARSEQELRERAMKSAMLRYLHYVSERDPDGQIRQMADSIVHQLRLNLPNTPTKRSSTARTPASQQPKQQQPRLIVSRVTTKY